MSIHEALPDAANTLSICLPTFYSSIGTVLGYLSDYRIGNSCDLGNTKSRHPVGTDFLWVEKFVEI